VNQSWCGGSRASKIHALLFFDFTGFVLALASEEMFPPVAHCKNGMDALNYWYREFHNVRLGHFTWKAV
jgi:hypothetical protein